MFITKIVILKDPNSADIIFVHTTGPSPMPKIHKAPPVFKVEVEADYGEEWARLMFGKDVIIETINLRSFR